MPTRQRKQHERDKAKARAEFDRLFGPKPYWLKDRKLTRRDNMWPIYHPSIRDQAETPDAIKRLEAGKSKGLDNCRQNNEKKLQHSIDTAVKLSEQFPKWREQGAAGKIANKTGANLRKIQRLIKILKTATGA